MAVLTDGSEVVGILSPTVSGGRVHQATEIFLRNKGMIGHELPVPLKDIKEIRMQSRPLQWAVFQNIPLHSPKSAGAPTSSPAAGWQAMVKLMQTLSDRAGPNWLCLGATHTVVVPMHWQGWEIDFGRKGAKPLTRTPAASWKIWIMDEDCPTRQWRSSQPLEAKAGPARRVGAWRGRQVFESTSGDEPPLDDAAMKAILHETDLSPTTQPATLPATEPGRINSYGTPA